MKFSIEMSVHADAADPAAVVATAQAAERAGFAMLGYTDHPAPSKKWLATGGHPTYDPFAALCFLAAVTTDICLVFPAISAVEAGFEVQAVLDASGSSFDIGEETSRRRMERAGVWLTSTNTMVAELVHNWATPQGMKLVPLIAANPPMLPVD